MSKTIYLGEPQDELWTICDPDSPVPSGEHMHKCHRCNTAWTHGNDLPDSPLTTAEFHMAHSCPRCGNEETYKYRVNEGDLRKVAEELRIPNADALIRSTLAKFQQAYERHS